MAGLYDLPAEIRRKLFGDKGLRHDSHETKCPFWGQKNLCDVNPCRIMT